MMNHHDLLRSAVFITFSGDCKQALSFYQSCFGGLLQFETFEKELLGYTELPVVSGSLVSDRIIIYGSDLVHNEGRKIGNYISIYLHFENPHDRNELLKKMELEKSNVYIENDDNPQLIEVKDAFDVRWVLGV